MNAPAEGFMADFMERPGKAARDLAVVGLGELLWDELPGGRRLGGAPANFAVMAARLGVHGIIASRLGEDERGGAALALLGVGVNGAKAGGAAGAKLGAEGASFSGGAAGAPSLGGASLGTSNVDARFLQTDTERATGSVSVAIRDGQPQYTIHAPVAWDALELTPAWLELAARADAVCWGTLAQRDVVSRESIHGFLAATRADCLRIFDVNLRSPFYTAEVVGRSLARATLLKLNDGEMPQLLLLAGLPAATGYAESDDAARAAALALDARRLLAAHASVQLVAITLGAHGSLLVTRDEVVRHLGIATVVVDTVGAGDAFTAALAVHRLLGVPLAVQSEAANRWGAWVAGQSGAMPELSRETLTAMENQIKQTSNTK